MAVMHRRTVAIVNGCEIGLTALCVESNAIDVSTHSRLISRATTSQVSFDGYANNETVAVMMAKAPIDVTIRADGYEYKVDACRMTLRSAIGGLIEFHGIGVVVHRQEQEARATRHVAAIHALRAMSFGGL